MQDNKKSNKAIRLISSLLKKEAKQGMRGDAGILADRLPLKERTISPYLRGSVADFNTGSIILTEWRVVIKEREDAAVKMVA